MFSLPSIPSTIAEGGISACKQPDQQPMTTCLARQMLSVWTEKVMVIARTMPCLVLQYG